MGEIDIRFYSSIFWRRFPYFLVIATVLSVAGIVIASLLPPTYRATSKILIESPQIPEQLARSTVVANGVDQIRIIEQRMMTSLNLLNLTKRLNVYDDAAQLSATDIVDDMRSRTRFEEIHLDSSDDKTAAFAVSFEAEDPVLAAEVAREMTELIIEENSRLRTGRATGTHQFFEQNVKTLGAELGRLEAELSSFKTKHKDALPDGAEFRRNEQARQQERLLQLEREEAALRDRRSNLARIFESTGRIPYAARPASAEEEMLEQLRRTLSEQQAVYSDKNPNIALLRDRIDRLAAKVQSRRDAAKADAPADDRKLSELVDIQLAEIDGRLSFIARDREMAIKKLEELGRAISATPANEVVLNSLERNYQNTLVQYNSVTTKLADASTGEQIELGEKGVQFSVIEMATPPEKPVPSKRLAIASGGIFAGLGAGLAFVMLLEFLNKSVRRPIELVQALDIQPFATIPYIRTPGEVLSKKLVVVACCFFFVAAIPGTLLAVHILYSPIDQWLGSLTDRLGVAIPGNGA